MAKAVSNAVVTVENGQLVVRVPMNEKPSLSASGKTYIVASANGETEIVVEGKKVVIGLNAYIKAK